MWKKGNFNKKRKSRAATTPKETADSQFDKVFNSLMEKIDISDETPEKAVFHALFRDLAKEAVRKAQIDPVLNNQFKTIPTEILWHILLYTYYRDWAHACLISKSWGEKLAQQFTMLKNFYVTHKESSPEVIVQESSKTTEVATMVFMSNLVDKLDFDSMLKIATHTPSHMEAAFRRGQFFIKKNYQPKQPSQLNITKIYGKFFVTQESFSIRVLYAMALASPQHAKQVIKTMGNRLNGYSLMRIGAISEEHAQLVLNDKEAKTKLSKGHLIGIAKSSPKHAKLFLKSPQQILEFNLEELRQIAGQQNQAVANILLYYANYLPSLMTSSSTKNIKSTVNIMLGKQFDLLFSTKNPFWVKLQEKDSNFANCLPKIFRLALELFKREHLIKHILLNIALNSAEHLKEILLISKTHSYFDEESLSILLKKEEEYKRVLEMLAPALLEKSHTEQRLSLNIN